jgi:hypothetical protein
MSEAVVTIKTTESELECLIWSLNAIKTIRLPIEPEWKKPYKALLKDLEKIRDGIQEEKRNIANDKKTEEIRGVDCKTCD